MVSAPLQKEFCAHVRSQPITAVSWSISDGTTPERRLAYKVLRKKAELEEHE